MIRIFPDYELMSREAAARIITVGMSALVDRDRFDLVLAGGGTPRRCYEILAERTRDEPDFWNHTHLYWSDERCVPPDHPDSNFRTAAETLLDVVKTPKTNVHRIEAEKPDRDAVAADYAERFPVHPDLLLLGMGSDGHTASLFPQSPTLDEHVKRFVPSTAPTEPVDRITLTPRAITAARSVLMLVSGPEKSNAMQLVFSDGDVHSTPAALVYEATWFVTNDVM